MSGHWAIFSDNNANKSGIINTLLKGVPPLGLESLTGLRGVLFSKSALERLMDEEERHDKKIVAPESEQSLRSMSSGEQKKELLNYLFNNRPDFIILDNPFDNLDIASQTKLTETLKSKAKDMLFVQLVSRKTDLLPFITHYARLEKEKLLVHNDLKEIFGSEDTLLFTGEIPLPLHASEYDDDILIHLNSINVYFGNKAVLKNINWKIKKGEFWQLIGKNGSGKTTLLSMLTGENSKGYGQELFLFGKKKGSGESIWDIKKRIGYFTPSMTDKFTGYHSIENMLISGLNDSIGLYIRPTEAQLRLAKEWLIVINMWKIKDTRFHDLSMGQKRLVMTVRAMIKHPFLLILDEPTAGLDDASAQLLVTLVNKIAKES
ncbi:ModF, partial [hydrothermal vent metagenome]